MCFFVGIGNCTTFDDPGCITGAPDPTEAVIISDHVGGIAFSIDRT